MALLSSSFWLNFNQGEVVLRNPEVTLKATINKSHTEFIMLPARRLLLLQSLSSDWYPPPQGGCLHQKPRHVLSPLLIFNAQEVTALIHSNSLFLKFALFSASECLT